MTKGHVFIGWSKDTALAAELKEKLSEHGLEGIIGGKSDNNIDPGVGVTVINQMRKSCSAIMLFTPALLESRAELSGNMLFELGYLFGTLRLNKVLIVYMDVPMEIIPSDLHGMWNVQIETKGRSNEEIADEILKSFFATQDRFPNEDKLDLLSEIEKLHYLIETHTESPTYYHNEIAQIVLLYGQAAYIFDDFTNATQLLQDLRKKDIQNKQLSLAIDLCLIYFEVTQSLHEKRDETGTFCLTEEAYERFRDSCLEMIEDLDELSEADAEFKYMFLSMAYQYLTFANMMYCANLDPRDIDDEMMEFRRDCGKKCLDCCNAFIAFSEQNENLGRLFKAYVYRNLAIFHKSIGEEDFDELFEKSITERKKLYKAYRRRETIAKHFVNQIRMEYFLSLSDNLLIKPSEIRKARIKELNKYIRDVNNSSFNRLYHIQSIIKIIEEAEAQ